MMTIEERKSSNWRFTNEGRNCHCNHCGTQFWTKEDFAHHWPRCPVRQRLGYVEPVIDPS